MEDAEWEGVCTFGVMVSMEDGVCACVWCVWSGVVVDVKGYRTSVDGGVRKEVRK